MKKVWILFAVSIFVIMMGCVYAGNLVKNVTFSPYPILLNDEKYFAEMPILSYQDRTYIALREFSEMIGVEINFVDNMILIDTAKEENEVIDEITEDGEDMVDEVTEEIEKTTNSIVEIVYITQSGSKYHLKNNCGKGTYYISTKTAAEKEGYEPCKKCAK